MSVVDGDWDSLKRYNLTELRGRDVPDPKEKKGGDKNKSKSKPVAAEEKKEPAVTETA